ncbi:hypothetical protein FHETE_7693 [Fusarium heterosporum]|uniref:Uncharacterized protein n=1 Tax=Fusarium heterosporum TaxID=42747 RepID=A0A8H5T5N6_FUSHE|nr:hypothetical protein FHETE_7693 [Fusarium heterosporum]
MSDHTRSQNMSLSRSGHNSLGSKDQTPHLIVDLRALRILLDITAAGQAAENTAVAEVIAAVNQSAQQSIQQQPFESQSTGLSSSDAVEVEASTVYSPGKYVQHHHLEKSSSVAAIIISPVASTEPHVPGTPAHTFAKIASSEVDSASLSSGHDDVDVESDIYTDHHVGGRPRKSAFQMRIEQVSKTRLSAFTSSALSFLTQTDVGHIVRSQENSGGQPPIPDHQKDDGATGSVTNGFTDVVSCSASKGSSSDSSETGTAGSRDHPTTLRGDDGEEDLISFDVTLCYDTAYLKPQASDSAPTTETETVDMMSEVTKADQDETVKPPQTADVSEPKAIPTVEPIAALEDPPSAQTTSMGGSHQLPVFRPESEVADTSSVRGETSFPPTCCGYLVPVDANLSTFDRKILEKFLAKKFGVDLGTPELAVCKYPSVFAPSPPTEGTLRDQLAKHIESQGKKLCHLCKKAIDKDAVCPDCCYRCSQPRGSCKCPWWEERQLKHSETATAFRVYNPKAPTFRPTISQPGPRQIKHQARPFGGLFPNQNRTAGAEPRGINCRHLEMKKMGKPGPCFDCKVKLPGGGWYCLQCHYLLCEKCKIIRHG